MAGPWFGGVAPRICRCLLLMILAAGCRGESGNAPGGVPRAATPGAAPPAPSRIVVNSLEDLAEPPAGVETLRSALARLAPGGTIEFDPSLDNGTIALSIVGNAHSVLKGERFTMVPGVGWQFEGFLERDYGASALYADKDVTIDASTLPSGITLRWAGGESDPARVLAVYGNLAMRNVTVLDGFSKAVPVDNLYTLARGGAVACWGKAEFEDCTFGRNRVLGDDNASRDRGAFGGAVYGDTITMDNCVVAGNRAEGYGAAGGGIYSVGGREGWPGASVLRNCAISGNRVTGQHAYGGGVYTDGGGIGFMNPLRLANCTIAGNRVEDNPSIDQSLRSQYYYRGGGVYMSNGWIEMASCTVACNEVTGHPYPFGGKPNMGGGGIAATIGNAHDVEDMEIWHSAIVGNRVGGQAEDLFTGSLVHFYSYGYNRIGRVDFGQMLVPVPPWDSLNRRHWPKDGDLDGVDASAALLLEEARRHPYLLSVGADAGERAVLWYPPADSLVDRVPPNDYGVDFVMASFWSWSDNNAPLLDAVVGRLRGLFGSGFGASLGDWSSLPFTAEPSVWPSDNANKPWIDFWHALDNEIGTRLGAQGMGDEFWGTFRSGSLPPDGELTVYIWQGYVFPVRLEDSDQRGTLRPAGIRGDIGAVERQAVEATPVPSPAGGATGSSGGCTAASGGGAGVGLGLLLPALAAAALRAFQRRPRGKGRTDAN